MKHRHLYLSLLAPALLQAQTPLTAGDALALARSRGPLAATAAGTRQVTQGRGRSDAAWPNPVAEWRRENYSSPLQPDIFATLQVPIDLTGRRLALRQAAQAATRRGREDSASVARQLDAEVLRAYWRASLATELAAIADSERVTREALATFDEQRFREGAVAEVVAMRARLEVDRARIAAANAHAELARMRADLARLLGTSPGTMPPLTPLAPPELTAIQSADTSWEAVSRRRPDLEAQRHAAAEFERRAAAESRGLLGDVNVVGGYKGTGGYATGLLGVMLPVPLFNRNEGPRERARGEQVIARSVLLDAEWRARADVEAATATWDGARRAGRDGAATMDARASEVARIAEAAYREGATSLLELVEALRARADARATAARWAADAHLARVDFQRATGLPFSTTP